MFVKIYIGIIMYILLYSVYSTNLSYFKLFPNVLSFPHSLKG